MSVSDPIADMLTRIRNASRTGAADVAMPHSRLKEAIARVLKSEGYIVSYESHQDGPRKVLRVGLRYHGPARPVIRGLRRISRPGLRRYVPGEKVPKVLGGLGVAILSTSRGLLTDQEARKAKIGGEVLCHIW